MNVERETDSGADKRAAAHRNGPVGCARAVHLIIELAKQRGQLADDAHTAHLYTMRLHYNWRGLHSYDSSNCNAKYERGQLPNRKRSSENVLRSAA